MAPFKEKAAASPTCKVSSSKGLGNRWQMPRKLRRASMFKGKSGRGKLKPGGNWSYDKSRTA